MIRVWTPAEQEDDPERFRLRGLVEHINSGDRAAFRGAGELLAFFEARLDGRPQPDRRGRDRGGTTRRATSMKNPACAFRADDTNTD